MGDYLRFHRDYFNINLMSMYNCFSDRMATSLNINEERFSFSTDDLGYKIYVIPVRFNQEYTIGIDCDTSIEMFAGFYSRGEIVVDNTSSLYNSTYVKMVNTKFKKPFLYSKLQTATPSIAQNNLEKNLVLYLKNSILLQLSNNNFRG